MGDYSVDHPGGHSHERVTMRTLNDGLNLVREEQRASLAELRGEQKAEHTKTRAWIAILGLPTIGKAVALVGSFYLGTGGWGWLSWPF